MINCLNTRSVQKMLFAFGSLIVIVMTVCINRNFRQQLNIILRKFIYEIKYNVLASHELLTYMTHKKHNDIELYRLSGRTAIVTGGSRGIGFVVVKMLLQCDMEVIIACRNITAGKKAINEIRKSGVSTGIAKVYELDNSNLQSVRDFVHKIKENNQKIDILINNAGVMFTPYKETPDGFEQQWAVNYLSHFLLTCLLLKLLQKGRLDNNCSRVINVSSCAHLLGEINFDDINYKNEFITSAAYAQSKLAQVMFTKILQEKLKDKKINIEVFSVHPGIVNTDLFQHSNIRKIQWLVKYMFKTPEEGATSIVHAAISKDISGKGGIYLNNCKESLINLQALDKTIQEKLFRLSLEHVQIDNPFETL